jgi:hypothetical protein
VISRHQPLVILDKVMRIEVVGEGRYDIGVAFTAVDSAYRLALKKYFEKNEQPRSKLRGIVFCSGASFRA